MLNQKQISKIKELQAEAYAEVCVCVSAAYTYNACEKALAYRKAEDIVTFLRAEAFVEIQNAVRTNDRVLIPCIISAYSDIITVIELNK